MASVNNLVIGRLRLASFTSLARARRIRDSFLNHPDYLSSSHSLI